MKKVLMVIITFIIICLSIWFQMTFLNSIPLSGVVANFGIVLIAGLGLVSGKFVGGIIGGVYGLLIDLAFARGIGLYVTLYALVGIISGYLNNSFSKGNKISMIMLILICTSFFEIVAYLFNILLNGFELDIKILIIKLVLESMYNILLTVLFFKPIVFYGELLNKTKNSYYLL